MGASAQATVLAVELSRLAVERSVNVLELSLLAHSRAQAGLGSGADIAAVFTGGIIRYRASPPDIARILPPIRARLAYVYSGESSRTSEVLADVEQRLSRRARDPFALQAEALGEAMEKALLDGDFPAVRFSVAEQEVLLSNLGVETEAVRRILSLVGSYGCAGKISGAGLGDGCVLFSPDPDTEAAMLLGLRAQGFWATELQIEKGLRAEAKADELARLLDS
jgi:phosphomevalonate kinase